MADLNIKPSSPAPGSGDDSAKTPPTAPSPQMEIKAPAAPAQVQPAATTPAVNPTAPKAEPAKPEDKKEETTYQNIFSKKDEKQSESKIISGVLKKKTTADKLKPILGHGPTLQKAIEQEKEITQKKKLRLVQSVMAVSFIAALAMVGYFYTSLSPDFNLWQNKTAQLTDMNKNIRSQQTQLNKYRYLAAQLDLNQFSFQADQYLDKVNQYHDPNTPSNQKDILAAGIDEAQFQMPSLIERIKDNLQGAITIDTFHSAAEEDLTPQDEETFAESDLRDALKDEKTLIAEQEDSIQKVQDLRLIDNTVKLVGNSRLLNSIAKTTADEFAAMLDEFQTSPDPAKRSELQEKLAAILASTRSDISTISSLKNDRLNWLTVITQIETVTMEVDSNFGRGLYETLGGILYSGYEFDSKTNKIVLSGETKTNDATNFTLTSELIDALERSPHFQDVEMRSFTKSGSPESGFTSSFKIDLVIEKNGTSDKNEPISLEPRKVAVKVKRTENSEASNDEAVTNEQ